MHDDDNSELSFEEDRKFREIAQRASKRESRIIKTCAEAIVVAMTCVLVAGAAWLVGQIVAHIPH